MAKKLLEVKNLSVHFTRYARGLVREEFCAVSGLDVSVEPGEILAVVGASGSGKSLLAHALLGILPHNARMGGDMIYKGEPLTQKRIEMLRGSEISLAPQGVSYLDPLMKVGGTLSRGRRDGETLSKIKRTLARFGLAENTLSLYPFQLSGGMARRVLISSAVIEKPELVIADEPTPGVNPEVARRIMGHFREMAQGGAGVLLITHDLELAAGFADRVAVFSDGRTVETTQASAFAAGGLKHEYTRALWAALPQNQFYGAEGEAHETDGDENTRLTDDARSGFSGVTQDVHESGGHENMRRGSDTRSGFSGEKSCGQYIASDEGEGVLEARNITFRYGGAHRYILEDFGFSLARGERKGLLAPSGYGKTTLCRILAGYDKPESGGVFLDEKPIADYGGRCPVQLIWQYPELAVNPRVRMKEVLREGAVEQRILTELGIRGEWLNRFPGELSGGELQRFCVARALGAGTRFILADEVTAMLDLVSQAELWRFLICETERRGIGLLAVSHSRPLLERICGSIMEPAPKEELL